MQYHLAADVANLDTVPLFGGCPVRPHASQRGVIAASALSPGAAAVAVAVDTIHPGKAGAVLSSGFLAAKDWSRSTGAAELQQGATYWLSETPGRLTTTPPSVPGHCLQAVGVAITPTVLNVMPMQCILL